MILFLNIFGYNAPWHIVVCPWYKCCDRRWDMGTLVTHALFISWSSPLIDSWYIQQAMSSWWLSGHLTAVALCCLGGGIWDCMTELCQFSASSAHLAPGCPPGAWHNSLLGVMPGPKLTHRHADTCSHMQTTIQSHVDTCRNAVTCRCMQTVLFPCSQGYHAEDEEE